MIREVFYLTTTAKWDHCGDLYMYILTVYMYLHVPAYNIVCTDNEDCHMVINDIHVLYLVIVIVKQPVVVAVCGTEW